MRWALSEVAAATSGRVDVVTASGGARPAPGTPAARGLHRQAESQPGPADTDSLGETTIAGAGIDSRRIVPGMLFVPIRAARDGHDFIAAAIAAGAAAFLWESGRFDPGSGPAGAPGIEVVDTARALLDLGREARGRLSGPVIGITGSVGKTSTKDLTAAALSGRWRVAASERSFNNELGVPLTLINALDDTEATVIEMGARGPGHITLLAQVARPTVAVVTAVAAVHTELFGSIEAVANAKAELVESLSPSGTAVLNGDDDAVTAMATRTAARIVRFSANGRSGADIAATDIRVADDLRGPFRMHTPWGATDVRLGVRGAHQVGNALAAAAAALCCDVPLAAVATGLGQAQLSPWRMELNRTLSGALVLNDSYNASPTSMAAALDALAALPAQRRVAVVGEMAELGALSAAAHQAIGQRASDLGVRLVVVGTPLYRVAPVAGIDEAVDALGPLGDGDAVLIKGSRVVGLERLAQRLLAR